ncbi:MAG: FAD-dependent oxidoreductase [Labedaea sp.]
MTEGTAGAIGRRRDVRVAVVGPFSGPRAAWGELLTSAIRRHRFPGIAWQRFDDRGDTELARQRAAEVVADGGFVAVLGHFNSFGAAAALPTYRAAGLPVLLPLSTGTGLLDGADGTPAEDDAVGPALRWCADDHGQVAALARTARRLGVPELLVTHDGTGYGVKLAEAFLEQAALPIAGRRLDDVPASGAIAVCGTHRGAAAVAKRLRAAGFLGELLFPDDCAVPEFAELVGEAAAPAYIAQLPGGATRHVDEAFAALAGTLIADATLTGADLLRMVRAHASVRFSASGDPQWTNPSAGWEVVGVAEACAGHTLQIVSKGGVPEVDCLVIGTGIVGTASAAAVAELGCRVALIGPGPDSPSATRHSGGLIRAYDPDPALRGLGVRSFELLWGREPAHSAVFGFHRTESLVLLGQSDVDEAQRGVMELLAGGVKAEMLSPEEVRQRWPDLSAPDIVAGLWEPAGGYTMSMATASAFRATALRAGVIGWHGKVIGVRPHRTGLLVETDLGPVLARTAVLATGSGVPDLRTRGGAAIGPAARVKRIRYGYFDARGRRLPCTADLVTGLWGRPNLAGESFLTGRPVDEWDVGASGGDSLTEAEVEHIRSGAVRRWPWLAGAEYLGGRFGADMYGSAGPMVGPVCDDLPIVAAGVFSGGGVKCSPAAAELVAERVRRLL